MNMPYKLIAVELYKKYPELGTDIWIKIIQQLKLTEKNIYKKINIRSYYNYKLNIIFTLWGDSHLKSRERYWHFIKFKNYYNYNIDNNFN